MGNWRLEVFKMAMYMSFPVGLFHIFNQPQYFEQWVISTKRQMYPPENPQERRYFEDAIRAFRERKDNELLKGLEEVNRENISRDAKEECL